LLRLGLPDEGAASAFFPCPGSRTGAFFRAVFPPGPAVPDPCLFSDGRRESRFFPPSLRGPHARRFFFFFFFSSLGQGGLSGLAVPLLGWWLFLDLRAGAPSSVDSYLFSFQGMFSHSFSSPFFPFRRGVLDGCFLPPCNRNRFSFFPLPFRVFFLRARDAFRSFFWPDHRARLFFGGVRLFLAGRGPHRVFVFGGFFFFFSVGLLSVRVPGLAFFSLRHCAVSVFFFFLLFFFFFLVRRFFFFLRRDVFFPLFFPLSWPSGHLRLFFSPGPGGTGCFFPG